MGVGVGNGILDRFHRLVDDVVDELKLLTSQGAVKDRNQRLAHCLGSRLVQTTLQLLREDLSRQPIPILEDAVAEEPGQEVSSLRRRPLETAEAESNCRDV